MCSSDLTVAATGSQAYRLLAALRAHYLRLGLVARIIPAVTYVVPENVRMIAPDRAEITLCEVDGSWQMDSRRTASTDDDVVWDDSLVSRRARHTLVRESGRWLRSGITELTLWPGENRCPPRPSV